MIGLKGGFQGPVPPGCGVYEGGKAGRVLSAVKVVEKRVTQLFQEVDTGEDRRGYWRRGWRE